MANQFINSFIRQMGRETAHDVYNSAGNYDTRISGIDENSFTTKLLTPNFIWLGVAFIVSTLIAPFFMIIPFVVGIIRIVSDKIRGHYRATQSIYKSDRRYRSGGQYLGEDEVWLKVKKPIGQCTDEEVKDARMAGLIEIAISVLGFFASAWIWAQIFC